MPKPSQSPAPASSGSAAPPPDPNADVAALGYEEARDELVAVVARLEAGAATLEESLALWERGEALATRCQEWLDGARERLSAVRDGGARPEDRTNASTDDEETR
ncbi:exodeoxyribonuclease VII small subunit [Cellulomonas sp. Leaf395]|uniref:exodeoxyribonuclease VII small subunit n=1 Tax=Cellulomonas sp. Leaf395 TaxID=1736362 RepID=UPI0009E73826